MFSDNSRAMNLSGILLLCVVSGAPSMAESKQARVRLTEAEPRVRTVVVTPLPDSTARDTVSLPQVRREFRAVWIATVGNMDWPSRKGLTTEQQKSELVRILDRVQELRFNAVIFQVRTAADAFYDSPHEPWSEYLTGTMGVAPEPFWDPLAFAIEEAHRRGLELHAWFNPFRARYYHNSNTTVAASHISRTRPQLVRRYGSFLWMDPGEPAVHEHSLKVITDVVRRYDIDGVHIDDYFYPYRERNSRTGRYIDFPDNASWTRYRRSGGDLSRDDWRRNNVDRFVEALYRETHKVKPWVEVGISPFGIWRPGNPKSVMGLDAFSEIYADARKWLNNGWLDYVVPQLYWRHDAPQQNYTDLLTWWIEQNYFNRHVYVGNAPYRVSIAPYRWGADEIVKQIEITRRTPGASGNVHFNASAIMDNLGGVGDTLGLVSYREPALTPASPWLGRTPPAPPVARLESHPWLGATLRLQPNNDAFLWVIRARYGDDWTIDVVPAATTRRLVTRGMPARLPDQIAVTAIDRNGNESPATIVPR